MRLLTSGILVASICLSGCRQTDEIAEVTWFTTEISQRKQYTDDAAPDLASIRSGIVVRFSENPVTASGPYTIGSAGGPYYLRVYGVSVACSENARIERWGVLELEGARWKHAAFSRADFADAFDCPDGELIAGRTYTFEQAHEIGSLPGKVRWYFVAADTEGGLIRGDGEVESAAKSGE